MSTDLEKARAETVSLTQQLFTEKDGMSGVKRRLKQLLEPYRREDLGVLDEANADDLLDLLQTILGSDSHLREVESEAPSGGERRTRGG